MANLRDIRRRIKSVKSTSQITKAMELVAAAKMKKAQDQAVSGRDYADQLDQVLAHLQEGADEDDHPLLARRGSGKELMLVVSTDRGLCGGLNTNLLKTVRSEAREGAEFGTVGKKLRQQLSKTGAKIVTDWKVRDPVPFSDAKPIAKFLTEQYLSGEYGRVTIAFTRFVTTLKQEPRVNRLLPVDPEALLARDGRQEESRPAPALGRDYIFEPNPTGVFKKLLPLYINYQVYQTLVEARASEHSARMVAMKSATDNANNMINDLTLEYNKLRQAAITAELLEITTAMKAME